jgi:hypothetical protein
MSISPKIQFSSKGVRPDRFFSAYRSADQSISNTTWTKVQFNAEDFDVGNCYDSVTNYVFTADVAGYYFFASAVCFAAMVDGNWIQMGIYKNAALFRLISSTVLGGSADPVIGGSTMMKLAAGDTVAIGVYQNYGAARSIAGGALYTSFTGYRIAPV